MQLGSQDLVLLGAPSFRMAGDAGLLWPLLEPPLQPGEKEKINYREQGFLHASDFVLGNDFCNLTNFFDSLFLQFQFLISGGFLPF